MNYSRLSVAWAFILLLACWFSTSFACYCYFSSSVYQDETCSGSANCIYNLYHHMSCVGLGDFLCVKVDCLRGVAFYYFGQGCKEPAINTLVDGLCVASANGYELVNWGAKCDGTPSPPGENCEEEEAAYEEEYSGRDLLFSTFFPMSSRCVSVLADISGESCTVNATFTSRDSCESYSSTMSFGADCQKKLLYTYLNSDCSGAPYVAGHNTNTVVDYQGPNNFSITPSFGTDCEGRAIVIPVDGDGSSSDGTSSEESSDASDGEDSSRDGAEDGGGSGAETLRTLVIL
ncbi:hypothetical protein QOT17_019585 [Balamuthia mandrillaris]